MCTVCVHEKAPEISRLLILGARTRPIAARYGLSKSEVGRHRQCIKAVFDERKLAGPISAEAVLMRLVVRLEKMSEDCLTERKRLMFLKVARELRHSARSYGQARGEIKTNQVTALFINLGVRDEDELRSAVEFARSSQQPSMEECREQAVALLRMVLVEHPEWRRGVVEQLGSGAEVVEAEVIEPEQLNGTNGGHA